MRKLIMMLFLSPVKLAESPRTSPALLGPTQREPEPVRSGRGFGSGFNLANLVREEVKGERGGRRMGDRNIYLEDLERSSASSSSSRPHFDRLDIEALPTVTAKGAVAAQMETTQQPPRYKAFMSMPAVNARRLALPRLIDESID